MSTTSNFGGNYPCGTSETDPAAPWNEPPEPPEIDMSDCTAGEDAVCPMCDSTAYWHEGRPASIRWKAAGWGCDFCGWSQEAAPGDFNGSTD